MRAFHRALHVGERVPCPPAPMVTPPSSQESGHVAAGSGRLMGTAHGASSERHECEDEIRR